MFQLQCLNVGLNELTELPRTIGNLTEIYHLDLSGNQINLDGLPTTFFSLKSLERLYLSDNKIEALVKEFSRLSGLQILALRYVTGTKGTFMNDDLQVGRRHIISVA